MKIDKFSSYTHVHMKYIFVKFQLNAANKKKNTSYSSTQQDYFSDFFYVSFPLKHFDMKHFFLSSKRVADLF